MRTARLLLALPLLHACAPTVDQAAIGQRSLPRLLTASPASKVGGEARYEGELQIRGNCIVVVSDGRAALPIFDSTVSLAETGGGIVENGTGQSIAIGERLRASAAHLRQDGEGWSLPDIEQATGANVPEGCGDSIVRLRGIGKIAAAHVTAASGAEHDRDGHPDAAATPARHPGRHLRRSRRGDRPLAAHRPAPPRARPRRAHRGRSRIFCWHGGTATSAAISRSCIFATSMP
ncbi:hypothetical protein [Sphingomonas sp. Ant20]|uniref:hypothetical protein n=1 Tax=Sphingomonas sp. Ant20 TaxID=104605 RepID=UPI000536BD41|nr:hypothetical protein NI18_13260 [Sphingomonas sp. Ant20]